MNKVQDQIFFSAMIIWILSIVPFYAQHNLGLLGLMSCLFFISTLRHYFKFTLPKISSVILLGVCIGSVFHVYGTLKGHEPGVSLLSLLAILKSFELSKQRDLFIFGLIIELLLVGHLLTSESLFYVVYIFSISFFLFLVLMAFHKNEALSKFNKKKIRVLVQIFIFSLPAAALMFFLFPRLYVGGLSLGRIGIQSSTGFTEELKAGDLSKLVRDQTPVFRAKFISKNKPNVSELYWRGAVLSKTDGFGWKPGTLSRTKESVSEGPDIFNYEINFANLETSHLFTLQDTGVIKKHSRGQLYSLAGGTYKILPFNTQRVSYEGRTKRLSYSKLREKSKNKYLQVPTNIGKRFKGLADSFKSKFENKKVQVQEFLLSFRKKDFFYTLNPGTYDTDYPVEEFYFDRKKGFCEHYASAAAIFFRLLGIPTRIVVGFHGGLYNDIGDYYIVRNEDAHSWVEVWFDDEGWKRVDPTFYVAPSRIELGSEYYLVQDLDASEMELALEENNKSFLKRAFLTFDMFYYELNRKFMNYDYDSQKDLFKSLGIAKKLPLKLLAILSLFCTFIFGFIYFSQKSRKHYHSELDQLYEKFCNKLSKQGMDRPPTMGPLDFLRKLKSLNSKSEYIDVINTYIEMKYGRNQIDINKFKKLI